MHRMHLTHVDNLCVSRKDSHQNHSDIIPGRNTPQKTKDLVQKARDGAAGKKYGKSMDVVEKSWSNDTNKDTLHKNDHRHKKESKNLGKEDRKQKAHNSPRDNFCSKTSLQQNSEGTEKNTPTPSSESNRSRLRDRKSTRLNSSH